MRANGSRKSRRVHILLDRSIATRMAPALAKFGFVVQTLEDVYGSRAIHVADTEWIEWSAKNGYIVFTANPNMVYVPHEMDAVREYKAKVFCVAQVQHTREGRALIYGRHLLRIVRRARRPGPCFWRVSPNDQVTRDIN